MVRFPINAEIMLLSNNHRNRMVRFTDIAVITPDDRSARYED